MRSCRADGATGHGPRGIAAPAIALGVPLEAPDADFDGVPGLDVVRD